MLSDLEKAKRMLRMNKLMEIKERYRMIDSLMSQFQQSRERNLLQELAQLMLINQTKSQVAKAMAQQLMLSPKEQSLLENILNE